MDSASSYDKHIQLERAKQQYFRAKDMSRNGVASSPATQKEYEFFLERIRFRLRDLGLSTQEIEDLDKHPEVQELVHLDESGLADARTAILVVHGIGQQNPYETLDQFARNLARYLRYEGGIDDLQVSAQKIDHNDWVEAMIRLETANHGPKNYEGPSGAVIDLFEYYWAPQTQDKVDYKQTLSWLVKTTLTPIRMLDQNVQAIAGEPDSEGMTRSAILGRELRRIGMLYIPIVVLAILLGFWLPAALKLGTTLKNIAEEWSQHPVARGAMTLLFAVSAVFYWISLKQGVAKLLRWKRRQTKIVDRDVAQNTFILAVVLCAVGVGIGRIFHVNLAQYFHPFLNWHVVYALLAAALARGIQFVLQNFVGDVAVYVNADAKAKNYAARQNILTGATQAIIRLLKDHTGYDRVIVAGHSLGSVIAYDSLNELMNRCQQQAHIQDRAIYAVPDQIVGVVPQNSAIHRDDLKKIKGLITFGSPLDKVHYFFREFIPENQAVRAQIIAFLHSFRMRGGDRDYGICKFAPYEANQLGHLLWLNAWSKQDPVSGMLHFYTHVVRKEFDYLIPVYAHLSYWEDLRFYEFFAEPMLFGREVIQPMKVMHAAV